MLNRDDNRTVQYALLLRPHVASILLPALSECPAIPSGKWSPSSPPNGTSTNDPVAVHLPLPNVPEQASSAMLIIQVTNTYKLNFCQ
jgi:hypothetical protein